jgi:uncharacterized membrane protein
MAQKICQGMSCIFIIDENIVLASILKAQLALADPGICGVNGRQAATQALSPHVVHPRQLSLSTIGTGALDMRILGMGHLAFALTMIALGLLGLFAGDFALVWQPVPPDIPGRTILACISGAAMFVMGMGVLIRRTAVPAAFALTLYTFIWLVVLHVPHLIASPQHEGNWGACGEIVVLVAGAWILYASSATPADKPYFPALCSAKAVRIAQMSFAVAVPLVGIEHFVYAKDTADMVPAWLPYHYGWAYFTGAAHIAAGVAIFFNVLPRLAAALETWMMGVFTVFVWVPAVMSAPSQRFAWTGLLISAVITAGAWIVVDSYRKAPWFSFSPSRNYPLGRLAT